jgi:hypothetical protein
MLPEKITIKLVDKEEKVKGRLVIYGGGYVEYYKFDDTEPLTSLTFHEMAALIERALHGEDEIEVTFDEDGIEIIDDMKEEEAEGTAVS